MTKPMLPLILLAVAAAGCNKTEPASNGATSEAPSVETRAPTTVPLVAGDGSARGTVQVSEDPTGVIFKVAATGLGVGAHGVHLHAVGMCDGPKFESAGGHWNPTDRKHGRDNPSGAHLGDLANVTAGSDGSAVSQFLVAGATLSGQSSLADADGTSLVIHAKADDYKTDPSGNSGERIACAVIAPPKR